MQTIWLNCYVAGDDVQKTAQVEGVWEQDGPKREREEVEIIAKWGTFKSVPFAKFFFFF